MKCLRHEIKDSMICLIAEGIRNQGSGIEVSEKAIELGNAREKHWAFLFSGHAPMFFVYCLIILGLFMTGRRVAV